jgi:hypothetical protein
MGTSAGFFGITCQGAVNGLASNTLSIFNMDHPNDRCWLKKVFDIVCPDGQMVKEQVPKFLSAFYRYRPEGPTQSGSYLYCFPPNECEFLLGLFSETATLSFGDLLETLQASQAAFVEPEAPLEYNSNGVLRTDMLKHTRRVLDPQQQFRKPLTTSQEVGWELLTGTTVPEVGKHPFHLRTSATTQFQDATEKHAWGRSIGGEFSAYASRKLLEFGGFGMGI